MAWSPDVVIAIGAQTDEPKEEMMSRVKETLVNDAEGSSRRRSSKRGAPKQADPPEVSRVPASAASAEVNKQR
jgi:putative DNA primase/helicase